MTAERLHKFLARCGVAARRKAEELILAGRVTVNGKTVQTVDTPFGRIGLSICYDLRFPELYRAMGEVDLIVVPSAFTETTGKA
ncbi:MAG: S4 domain-containing protein, partial [Planctomycetota bacterium]|nr:S4 domain-containing protein [Planctomycetota bacterium]